MPARVDLDAPDTTEQSTDEFIAILDPGHPLAGRTLRLAAREIAPGRSRGSVLAFHESGVMVRIPSEALEAPDPSRIVAKLNREAVEEIVELARTVIP